jgi:hypothetical protein
MKLSEHIEYCKTLLGAEGDHEITKRITGNHDQYKAIQIGFDLEKSGWIKKKTVSENEEIITKTRQSIYSLIVVEEIKRC